LRLKLYKTIILIGLSSFVNWLLSSHKPGLDKFPEISSRERILILAPHIDDETIGAGGLIQKALEVKAKIKIVYFTNGDENFYSLIRKNKNLKFAPNEFIQLGQQRMKEGKKAMEFLGLNSRNLIFLGYPDGGLLHMFSSFFTIPYTAKGTEMKYNPYKGTFRKGQSYIGENVISDLKTIINTFQPSIIFVSHPRDRHPDHRAVPFFLEKTLKEINHRPRVFAYLVHYHKFPPHKGLFKNEFLYPPKRLFTKIGWYSYDLSARKEEAKLRLLKFYRSQISSFVPNFLFSFVKRNEVFEEIEE
jgi:LmbE family N-acetylglucosaminyl deacetylase